ncbi:MAG: MarR family transcriptional regulator [Candidatus Thorarchaeota archaeon]|nr:MarR family transcriptional regulator [Candidatus Thorarchaeota archaeon]
MTDRVNRWISSIDVVLVVIAVAVFAASLLVWLIALPVPRETVFLATTIALVISLMLVVNVSVLVIFRLQRRVSDLEDSLRAGGTDKKPVAENPVIVVTLSNTERRVINSLEECGGRMTQDELRMATGLSKSTLSVAISSLERKSLVDRETHGRTKLVILVHSVTK